MLTLNISMISVTVSHFILHSEDNRISNDIDNDISNDKCIAS